MESTLFTELTVSEQASVSGGSTYNRGNISIQVDTIVQANASPAISINGDAGSQSTQLSSINASAFKTQYEKSIFG